MNALSNYQPTKVFPSHAALVLAVVGLVMAVILGVAYAYATIFIPLIYVNFLCSIVVGAVFVWLGDFCAKKFMIQHPQAVKLMLVMMAGVAFVLSWLTWLGYYAWDRVLFVDMSIEKFFSEILNLVQNPDALWDLLLALNESGTRSLGRGSGKTDNISGILLFLVWLIEALIFFGYPALFGGKQAKKPFDQQKNEWVEPISTGHFPLMSEEEIEQAIIDGEYSIFEGDEGEDVADQPTFTFEIYSLSDGSYYMSATEYNLEKGEWKASELIDEYLEVPKQFVDHLRSNKYL